MGIYVIRTTINQSITNLEETIWVQTSPYFNEVLTADYGNTNIKQWKQLWASDHNLYTQHQNNREVGQTQNTEHN